MTLQNPKNKIEQDEVLQGFKEMLEFPLIETLLGRRSRRFALGDEIPDGPLKYKSRHEPVPLSELERMVILVAMGGNTGWHHAITRNASYAPHFPNYSAAAGGRTFPSAAGFHVSNLFFTDDKGVYYFDTRDLPAQGERDANGELDLNELLAKHRGQIRKLQNGRLYLPREEPYFEGHNTWCVNVPGSLLVIPVGDVSQTMVALLCFLGQNGLCIYDDINNRQIPGIDRFKDLVDTSEPLPLTFVEQYALTETTAELTTSCYAGALTLQAMGLGGWMFDGIDRFCMLGASGNPEVPALGFNYIEDERWSTPHITGLPGIFEGYCPPHYGDMSEAVDAFCERKFGKGGPFNPSTPGQWKNSAAVRGAAQVHDEKFREMVSLQAQYILDYWGKFPATVPAMFILTYLQAHHLDLEFYDHHFNAGSYLQTHRDHMRKWHES